MGDMVSQPSVSLTFDPPGPVFAISEDCVMPAVKVTANLKDFVQDPKSPPPVYEWKATLAWAGANCIHSVGRVFTHPDMVATGPNKIFTIPFSKLCGGDLTVSVTVRSGTVKISASSKNLSVVGTNPTVPKLTATVPVIGAFRKLMRIESGLRQFRSPGCPLFSGDNFGGVGLCQLTSPPPTDDQVWSWKANVSGGAALYRSKQEAARQYPAHVRNSAAFKTLVKTYNDKRMAQNPAPTPAPKALDIALPDYTDEQLERDTLRGFNGYAGGLHEYRVKTDKDGMLVVTVDPGGTKGSAEWERVSAADRTAFYDSIQLDAKRRGDINYVDDVEAQASF